ncbi:MAG: MoaD/ThiS family protein [Candidatus Bathyarchaeia archaeon]
MVKVKVRYFGRIRELTGLREEEYEVENATSLAELLLKHIPERHNDISREWRETVFTTVGGEVSMDRDGNPVLRDNYVILVNGRVREVSYRLMDGDEVAVLPPVGGG